MTSSTTGPAPAGAAPLPSRALRWVLPVVAVLLTALAGGVLLWAVQGHQQSGPAVPVAIVNADKPVTTGSGKDQKTVAAGRQLAGALSQPATDDQTPLSWNLVDQADADAGLVDGTYYAVLTIPESFSADVTSTSGKKPQQAVLKLLSNDAASTAVAALADLSVRQAAVSLGDQVTTSYVSTLLTNITTIHTNLTSSATSAQKLADSSHQLASSSHQLAGSADDLADGSTRLAKGATSLASGAGNLASGAAKTASGAADVSKGSASLASAAGKLASGARRSAAAADRLSGGAAKVARLNGGVSRAARSQARQLDRLHAGSGRVATGAAGLAADARTAADDCPAAAGAGFCARIRALAVRARVGQAATRVLDVGVGSAARRGGRLQTATAASATASRGLERGTSGVAKATHGVSTGAAKLHRAADQLTDGARSVASGAASVADGAQSTSTAAGQLASGAGQQAAGSAQLATGAHSLADGADSLAGGADSLSSGLASGAKSVPSYTKDETSQLADVVTTPVGVTAKAQHGATVAASLVPVVFGLAVWLGTLMMFLTRGAVPRGPAWGQASAGRRVVWGWLPAVGVGVLEAALLLVLVVVTRVHIASPGGFAAFCLIGVLAFAATNQALVAVFGSVGRLVSLAFAVIEAAALGGLVPIQTAPGMLQWLNQTLPLPRFVDAAGQLLLGGQAGDLVGSCVVLVAWTLVALAVSALAVGRRRPALPPAVVRDPPRAATPQPAA